MAVRPHPTKQDPNWWQIDYRPHGRKGKRKVLSFEGTEQEARAWEMELRRQAKGDTISQFPSLNECVVDFLAEYEIDHQPAGVDRVRRSLKHLLPVFGSYQFSSLTPALITKYKMERLKSVKHTTVNKELAALSSFANWAEEKKFHTGIIIKRFPTKMVKAPKPTILSKAEVMAFLKACKEETRGLFACMYYAGLRRGEACNLRVTDVDFFTKTIRIVSGKGNKERIVPMIKPLEKLLKARVKVVKKGLLFEAVEGGPREDLRNVIKWACKRAKIRHIYPHLLRHAFGAHATASGINLRTLQEIMGHSNSVVTEIYTQVTAENTKKEMRKFK